MLQKGKSLGVGGVPYIVLGLQRDKRRSTELYLASCMFDNARAIEDFC